MTRWGPLVVGCCLLLMGCQDSSVARQPGRSKDMYPDQESWESRIIISRQDNLVAVADSKRLVRYDTRDMVYLIGDVEVDFYNPEGQHVSHLSSDSANVNIKTNLLRAFGNVHVRSDSGLALFTQTLTWNDEYEMVTTRDTVMFTTLDNDTLHGVGFESDVDLTHWKIYRPRGVTDRSLDEAF